MEKVYGIIYKTTNLVNGKIYIGQTIRLNNENYLGSGISITLAIKKYGKENFKRETLKECYNQIELDEWENLLIWEYNSRDKSIGYNIAQGSVMAFGESNHMKLPEVRAKVSAANKGKPAPNKGKKTSEEIRKKIGAASKGRTHSAESRAKLSASLKGKNHGKKRSAETRAKISEAMKGRKHSEETRAKLSASLKGKYKRENNPNYGKKHSEETRAKMREAKSIPVLQYDKQGNFIAEYCGAKEAERQTGIYATNITKCCKGKLKSAKGYKFKYKKNVENFKISA